MSDSQSMMSTTAVQETDVSVGGVRLHIDGHGPQTLVMAHGWPDTWELWEAQVQHFAPLYRCVRFTWPGFDGSGRRRGYSLDELVGLLQQVVDRVSPMQPVVLMLHDWGCLFGLQYAMRFPHRVARVVAIDVGDAGSRAHVKGLTLGGKLMVALYQGWLMLAWRLGAWAAGLANGMTRFMARSLGHRGNAQAVNARMNYPYDITWTGSYGGYRRLPPPQLSCPLFFAWAKNKPVHFHSGPWVQQLVADPKNRAEGFDCGHWVMRSRAGAFNEAVSQWLAHTAQP